MTIAQVGLKVALTQLSINVDMFEKLKHPHPPKVKPPPNLPRKGRLSKSLYNLNCYSL
jgi:hypothetical protein